jgi:hypothetical protein
MASPSKQTLVHFLEQKAFQPVLRADPAKYPENKRAVLKDMQGRTETEIERFKRYGSADEVITNLRRDLNSAPAKKVHQALRDLGLPTLPDLRDEFEELAARQS